MNTLTINTINSNKTLITPIQERWSPRALSGQSIPRESIKRIFEAARWAPSSNNLQPWRFIWAEKGTKDYDKLFDLLAPFNQSWVPPAPILVLAGYYKFNPNGDENFHALYDLGQAVAFLTLQAHQENVAIHQMGGFDQKAAHKLYGNSDHHFATMLALGYYGGDIELLPEDLQKAERKDRERKSMESIVQEGLHGTLLNH